MPWTGSGWRRFVPQPTVQARPRIARLVKSLPPGARWVDLGAGGRRLARGVIRVDRDFGQPAEVLSDAHRLPFRAGSLDAVVATGLLEHVRDPEEVLREIRRGLREEGTVYIEVPFLQGYHADPDDYWRFTESGVRLLLENGGFAVEGSGAHMGPASALCWILSDLAGSAFGRPGLLAGRLLVWPLKFLDYALMALPGASRVASGVWAIGRKPAPEVR